MNGRTNASSPSEPDAPRASSTSPAPRWITLAQILRPQGRRGEVLAELLTDFPERFKETPRVYLAPANFSGPAVDAREATVTGYWLPVGKNAGRIVLAFSGIDSISAAETLARLELLVPEEQRVALDEDAEYIDDLEGCTVFDGTVAVGVVTGVEFPTTADGTRRLDEAAPLLTVTTPEDFEVLIPYVKAYLVSVDTQAKRIEMTLPEGLVELNHTVDNG